MHWALCTEDMHACAFGNPLYVQKMQFGMRLHIALLESGPGHENGYSLEVLPWLLCRYLMQAG